MRFTFLYSNKINIQLNTNYNIFQKRKQKQFFNTF